MLKQLKHSLIEKSEILNKLDSELIEKTLQLLEMEIEQADLVKKEISLAVINIDQALEAKAVPTRSSTRRVQWEASSSEGSDGELHPMALRKCQTMSSIPQLGELIAPQQALFMSQPDVIQQQPLQ
jgi:hypothetical protein